MRWHWVWLARVDERDRGANAILVRACWVWVWPGVTSANYTERALQQSEFSTLYLSACYETCASVVVIVIVHVEPWFPYSASFSVTHWSQLQPWSIYSFKKLFYTPINR